MPLSRNWSGIVMSRISRINKRLRVRDISDRFLKLRVSILRLHVKSGQVPRRTNYSPSRSKLHLSIHHTPLLQDISSTERVQPIMNFKKEEIPTLLDKLEIVLKGDEKELEGRALLKIVMKKLLPAADALLEMIAVSTKPPESRVFCFVISLEDVDRPIILQIEHINGDF